MFTNCNSKIKYPSFRIDDILNNNFKSNNNQDDPQINELNYDDKFDQPINLSSLKFEKQQTYDGNEFNKNLKSISSISSPSPTLSVGSPTLSGSSDSPTCLSNFQNHHHQFSSISNQPIIDQLIKYNNLNDNLQNFKLLNSANTDESFNQQSFLINQYSQSIDDFYLKFNKNNHLENNEKQTDDDSSNDNLKTVIKKLHQDCKYFF